MDAVDPKVGRWREASVQPIIEGVLVGAADVVPEDDRLRYAGQMERIKGRIDEAQRVIDDLRDERGLLYAATQLRLAVEEIAFASLVGNRSEMAAAEYSLSVGGWDKAMKALRRTNPEFWPRGVIETRGESNEWVDRPGRLADPDVARVWGRLSRLLHARNPWTDDLDLAAEADFVRHLVGQLRVTLSSHVITLAGGRYKLLCQVGSEPVSFYIFERVAEGRPE